MSQNKICPICGGKQFVVSAHVIQDWLVDDAGEFLQEINPCCETTHAPDNADLWTCDQCGYTAPGKELEPEYQASYPLKPSVKGNQKLYRKILTIPLAKYAEIKGYLNAKIPDQRQSENETITFTVAFPDGRQMDIKCCGSQSEPSYTEAVLFSKEGGELRCSDVRDTLLGEWSLGVNGITYTVLVRLEQTVDEEEISLAYKKGIIYLAMSETGNAVIAKIGDEELYFGGPIAEQYNDPVAYMRDMERRDIIHNIYSALEDLRMPRSGDVVNCAETYMVYVQYITDRFNDEHTLNHSAQSIDYPIVASAIKYRVLGESDFHVLMGRRHADCVQLFKDMELPTSARDMAHEVQGFVTASGQFVDRQEALAIAVKLGQCVAKPGQTGLFSENLEGVPGAEKLW